MEGWKRTYPVPLRRRADTSSRAAHAGEKCSRAQGCGQPHVPPPSATPPFLSLSLLPPALFPPGLTLSLSSTSAQFSRINDVFFLLKQISRNTLNLSPKNLTQNRCELNSIFIVFVRLRYRLHKNQAVIQLSGWLVHDFKTFLQ